MDERFRGAGRAARTEIESAVDVDGAWREMTARIAGGDDATIVHRLDDRRADRTRRRILVAAAAACIALVVGVAVVLGRPDTVRTTVPTTVPTTAPTTGITTVPRSTTPAPTTVAPTTAASTTAAPTVAPTTPLLDPVAITVSYLETVPEAALTPIGTYPYASPDQIHPQYAVGEDGVVIVFSQGALSRMGWDGVLTDVGPPPDISTLASPVVGPDDVLYALDPDRFEMVAIATGGERQGQVIASAPLGDRAQAYGELPRNSFGLGQDGVVDLARDVDALVMGYVDPTGQPIPWPGAALPPITFERLGTTQLDTPSVVGLGGRRWQLSIDRDPAWSAPYEYGGVGRGPQGSVVYPTTIGAALEPGVEYADNARPVIAVLRPDNSGTVVALPDGWTFEASSPWGVLVSRVDTTNLQVELALLDLRVPAVDPLAAFATEPAPVDIVCDPGTVCVQLDVDAEGVVTSSRFDNGEVVRWNDPPVIVSTGLGRASLIAVGPDDVAYLAPVETDESGGEVVAVSLAAADAGRVIRRWPAVLDISGDTQLIPTASGLVAVGCCGPDQVRPDPGAAVAVPWVSRDGTEIAAELPTVRWDLATRTVTIDGRTWTPDLAVGEGGRGMPMIVPTADGGFLGAFTAADGMTTVIAHGIPDGASEQVRVTSYPVLLHPDGTVWFVDTTTGRLVVTAPFAD